MLNQYHFFNLDFIIECGIIKIEDLNQIDQRFPTFLVVRTTNFVKKSMRPINSTPIYVFICI